MFKRNKSQAVLEYTILFAAVTAALVASVIFVNTHNSLKSQFNSEVAVITGE
jgi:uncharacterized protein (UPF0333 family)